jgi:hypothetical protein
MVIDTTFPCSALCMPLVVLMEDSQLQGGPITCAGLYSVTIAGPIVYVHVHILLDSSHVSVPLF